MTKIWEAISHEFFDGHEESEGSTNDEDILIEHFISQPRFTELLNDLVNTEIIQEPQPNYSNTHLHANHPRSKVSATMQ